MLGVYDQGKLRYVGHNCGDSSAPPVFSRLNIDRDGIRLSLEESSTSSPCCTTHGNAI